MRGLSNFPPGVTGREPQIAGDPVDYEDYIDAWLAERETAWAQYRELIERGIVDEIEREEFFEYYDEMPTVDEWLEERHLEAEAEYVNRKLAERKEG